MAYTHRKAEEKQHNGKELHRQNHSLMFSNFIATKLEQKDGKLTGKFNGNNCYGTEKVLRIKEKYNLKEFEKIYAYGDSKGDREMLALAHEGYFKWEKT